MFDIQTEKRRLKTINEMARDQNFEENQQPQTKPKINKYLVAVLLFVLSVALTSYILVRLMKPPYKRNVLFYPSLNLPVHFTWLGPKPLPKKYAERLKKLNFPYKLLGQEDYAEFKNFFKFDPNISVSKRNDAFRLRYLWKYGGIYSDLDYVIDHQCLMMKLQGLDGTYYAMEQDKDRKPVSSLLYASKPGDPILDEVTKIACSRQNETTLDFILGYMALHYPDLKTIDLDACAYHQFDGTWIKDDANPW